MFIILPIKQEKKFGRWLHSLSITDNSITHRTFVHILDRCPNLHFLQVHCENISDISEIKMVGCPHLKKLDLSCKKLIDLS